MPTREGTYEFPQVKIQYDICFIGRDKGRYQEIKKPYKSLSDAGIRCLFYVLTDTPVRDEYDATLWQIQTLKFSQILLMEASAEILLDYTFVKGGKQGPTLRVIDAVGLNKGIISNNKYLRNRPIWNDRRICLIDQLTDITPQMIQYLLRNRDEMYNHKHIFSGVNLLSAIEQNMTNLD